MLEPTISFSGNLLMARMPPRMSAGTALFMSFTKCSLILETKLFKSWVDISCVWTRTFESNRGGENKGSLVSTSLLCYLCYLCTLWSLWSPSLPLTLLPLSLSALRPPSLSPSLCSPSLPLIHKSTYIFFEPLGALLARASFPVVLSPRSDKRNKREQERERSPPASKPRDYCF